METENTPPESAPPFLSAPEYTETRSGWPWSPRARGLRAVGEAAQRPPHKSAERLARLMGHRDTQVSAAASSALRACGSDGFRWAQWALSHGPSRRRAAAAHVLGEWGDPAAIPELLKAFRAAEKTSNRSALGCGCVAAIFLNPILFPIIWAVISSEKRESRRRLGAICTAFGRIGDPVVVADLARLAFKDRQMAPEVFQALDRLAPTVLALSPVDVHRLGPDAVFRLAELANSSDPWMAQMALRFLEAVGDGRAIVALDRLLRTAHPSFREEVARVRQILVERASREEARFTLLRGASADIPDQSGELLRAASAGATVVPEHLLRASEELPPATPDTKRYTTTDASAEVQQHLGNGEVR